MFCLPEDLHVPSTQLQLQNPSVNVKACNWRLVFSEYSCWLSEHTFPACGTVVGQSLTDVHIPSSSIVTEAIFPIAHCVCLCEMVHASTHPDTEHSSVGIPELRSVDDLNYMKVALALHRKEPEARDYFRGKLQEARRKAWTISMNWYVHGLAKDNSKV